MKATRRELRRAVGVSAIATMQDMDMAIRSQRQCLNDLAADYVLTKQDARMLREHVIGREKSQLTFLGRLRWLFTGK